MNKPNTGELVFFWILFGAVSLLSFAVMSPYITAIFLAAVFSILFSPIHVRLRKWLKGNETYSALLTVLLFLALILVPMIFLGIMMSQEVLAIYDALLARGDGLSVIDQGTAFIENYVRKFIPAFELNANIYGYLEAGLRWIGGNLNAFLSGIVAFVSQLLLVLIAMFFFYRDGEKLHDFALKWSPLSDSYDEGVITKLEVAVNSVVKGALATAILQGTLVGVGFAIFGIPNPVLWGVISCIAAFVPVVGSSFITIPTGVWLILSGHLWAGVGFIAWAVLVVGLIDNVTRPMLIRHGVDIHPFLILLSVLGGLAYFGPVGFLAGPVVLAFFFALLGIYPDIVRGRAIEKKDSL